MRCWKCAAASPLAFRADVWLAAARLAVKEKRPDDARKFLNNVIQAKATLSDRCLAIWMAAWCLLEPAT